MSDNPHIPPGFLKTLKDETDAQDTLVRREYLGKYVYPTCAGCGRSDDGEGMKHDTRFYCQPCAAALYRSRLALPCPFCGIGGDTLTVSLGWVDGTPNVFTVDCTRCDVRFNFGQTPGFDAIWNRRKPRYATSVGQL